MSRPPRPNDGRDAILAQRLDTWARQPSVWRAAKHLAAGNVPPAPLAVELHLGTSCNLACPECVSRPTLDSLHFERTRAVELASELVALGVRTVVLSGGGEPLLQPAVDDVLKTLHRGNVTVSLVTNGTLLHEHTDAVVECAARIWVSVDAATPETHQRFRPSRSGRETFSQVVRNLEALAPKTRRRLTYSFLLLTRRSGSTGAVESNVGDLAAAAVLARELGCSTFEVNLAFDDRLRVDPAHASVSEELRVQLQRAAKLGGPDFRVFVGQLVTDVAEGRPPSELPSRTYDRCPGAMVRALVSPRGVFLCPRHQGLGAARFGDPASAALTTLWGSDAHRRALRLVDPRVDCDGACMSMELNEKLLAAIAHARANAGDPELTTDDDLFL
jgi:hypothetical protein